jgi:hypothetical protein
MTLAFIPPAYHSLNSIQVESACREGAMKKSEILRAWAGILAGRAPSLSIEITKECPLRCPGCYAFDAAHLGGSTQLRDLSDFRGEVLVARVLALVDEHKPLHVSACALPRSRDAAA